MYFIASYYTLFSTTFILHLIRKMFEQTSLQLMRTSINDIRRGNMDTHQPNKEQAQTKKERSMINITHHDKGHIIYVIELVRSRQGTTAEYEIAGEH